MKYIINLMLAALLIACAATAVAGQPAEDCKLQGSWIGYDQTGNGSWMTTADGQSASSGTLNLEMPTAVNFFPGAYGITETRGRWERTGGNTFDWTVYGFAYGEFAQTLYIVKLSGKDTIGTDCDMLYVSDVVMEVYAPDADLYADDPMLTSDFPPHVGHRLKVDLP